MPAVCVLPCSRKDSLLLSCYQLFLTYLCMQLRVPLPSRLAMGTLFSFLIERNLSFEEVTENRRNERSRSI